MVARVVARPFQVELSQPVVIENKAGAGGLIGAEAVAKAAPDGYTFLLSANGPVLYAPELAAHKTYDWRRDFVPVGTISLTSLALVVHPSVPAKTLPEFIDLARREGTKLVFASGGTGTSNHLFSELIQSQLNLKWTTAQYKGTAPAMNDLIGGHVQFSIDQISASLPLIKDGRVRALAVSGSKRVPWLPDVPTFVEQGYKRTGRLYHNLPPVAGSGSNRSRQAVGNENQRRSRSGGLFHSHRYAKGSQQQILQI